MERERETERDRDRQTDRDRERETERDRERQRARGEVLVSSLDGSDICGNAGGSLL